MLSIFLCPANRAQQFGDSLNLIYIERHKGVIGLPIKVLSNHYVHTGYHEMRTHRRDSVHVLAVTRAVVLEICSRRRFIFKMSTNRGKGKNNSFSMIFFFPIKGMKVQQTQI